MARTLEDVEREIEKLEKAKFSLAMQDHWSALDFDRDRELFNAIQDLKAEKRRLEKYE